MIKMFEYYDNPNLVIPEPCTNLIMPCCKKFNELISYSYGRPIKTVDNKYLGISFLKGNPIKLLFEISDGNSVDSTINDSELKLELFDFKFQPIGYQEFKGNCVNGILEVTIEKDLLDLLKRGIYHLSLKLINGSEEITLFNESNAMIQIV